MDGWRRGLCLRVEAQRNWLKVRAVASKRDRSTLPSDERSQNGRVIGFARLDKIPSFHSLRGGAGPPGDPNICNVNSIHFQRINHCIQMHHHRHLHLYEVRLHERSSQSDAMIGPATVRNRHLPSRTALSSAKSRVDRVAGEVEVPGSASGTTCLSKARSARRPVRLAAYGQSRRDESLRRHVSKSTCWICNASILHGIPPSD